MTGTAGSIACGGGVRGDPPRSISKYVVENIGTSLLYWCFDTVEILGSHIERKGMGGY